MNQITHPRGSDEPKIEKYEFKTITPEKRVEKPTDTSEICAVFYIYETDRGLFVQAGDGEEFWLPKSQLRNFPRNTYLKGSIIFIDISHWLLRQDIKLKSLKTPIKHGSTLVEKEIPRININVKLVANTSNAVLIYDPVSDLDSWIPKKLIQIEGKYNFRKNKKMTINIPEWFAEKYKIGKKYN